MIDETQTVFVVDDDSAIREAVASLVSEMSVRCEVFGSAEDFLDAYRGQRPACLVTDVRMLRMSGLELQEEMQRRGHNLATVVLTAYAETPVTVRAIKNGAVTLLEKPCRNLELWDAIRNALAQDQEMFEQDRQRAEFGQRIESLTPSERRVMDLVVAGKPNKAIANELEMSVRTVEVRRQSIFAKLGATSVAELVRIAIESQDDS